MTFLAPRRNMKGEQAAVGMCICELLVGNSIDVQSRRG
jgi:hypothetical protein